MNGTQQIRLVFLAGSLFLAISLSSVAAGPAQFPKRVVNGQTVDLTALFRWWTNQSGSRPLRSWGHVTGTVVSTNAWGWVLEGHSDLRQAEVDASHGETHANSSNRLLLRNPPVFQKVEFEQLSARMQDLKKQRDSLVAQETRAKDQEAAIAHSGARGRVKNAEVRQVKAIESEASKEVKQLDAAIGEIKKKMAAYPSASRFEVDCFALFTARTDRMPVYDFGMVPGK